MVSADIIQPRDGRDGTNGTNGANGTNGLGEPAGGTTGQVLAKIDATDYNTHWIDPPAGGGAMYIFTEANADATHALADDVGSVLLLGSNTFNATHLTLPANPHDGQTIFFYCFFNGFGAYTLNPNTGQTSTPSINAHLNGYDTRKYTAATTSWDVVPGAPQ